MLKTSHDAAMLKVDELSAQLKDERMKSLDLEKQLQCSTVARMKMDQVSNTTLLIRVVESPSCQRLERVGLEGRRGP